MLEAMLWPCPVGYTSTLLGQGEEGLEESTVGTEKTGETLKLHVEVTVILSQRGTQPI